MVLSSWLCAGGCDAWLKRGFFRGPEKATKNNTRNISVAKIRDIRRDFDTPRGGGPPVRVRRCRTTCLQFRRSRAEGAVRAYEIMYAGAQTKVLKWFITTTRGSGTRADLRLSVSLSVSIITWYPSPPSAFYSYVSPSYSKAAGLRFYWCLQFISATARPAPSATPFRPQSATLSVR